MIRRWWNRWLVRLGLVDPEWRRATYDANTGWHESFRLRKGGDRQAPAYDDWVMTHRWHDDDPTGIMDRAAFHVWADDGGWRFGPSAERTVVGASASGDEGDIDIRAAVRVDDWAVGDAAVWRHALSDEEILEAQRAMISGDTYLELPDAPLHFDAEPFVGPPLVSRPLPDDSRGVLVTDLIGSEDGPHVPASMRTDQIPLPQDFDYPSPAIDLDTDR